MEAGLEPTIRNVPHYYLFFFFNCLREPVRRPGQYVKFVSPTAFNMVALTQQMMLEITCEWLVRLKSTMLLCAAANPSHYTILMFLKYLLHYLLDPHTML